MSSISTHFERLVEDAFAEIPEAYREACGDLAIRIEPHAVHGISSPLLSSPIPSTCWGSTMVSIWPGKSVLDLPQVPDEVILYRDPIIAYAKASGNALADVVKHVLVHEIGHHFGFSDADHGADRANRPVRIGDVMNSTDEMAIGLMSRLMGAGLVMSLLMACAASAGEITKGRELAERLCASCHMNPGTGRKARRQWYPELRSCRQIARHKITK